MTAARAEAAPTAIVSGGASGIGRAVAERLASDGFAVVLLDRDGARAREVAAALVGRGLQASAEAVDLTDHAAVRALVARLPPCAALVNAAGIAHEGAFLELAPEDFRRLYEVNLVSLVVLSQAVAARMAPGGKIVNLASRVFLGARGQADYVASKAAVVGVTRAMAMELVGRGILVNAIAPGWIDTPMTAALSPEHRAAQLALQPNGQAGRPEDVAQVASFLVSPRTDFITGQTLIVDGGKSLGTGLGL